MRCFAAGIKGQFSARISEFPSTLEATISSKAVKNKSLAVWHFF